MERKKQRSNYITPRQKRKLLELLSKQPELISAKFRQGFSIKDSQKLWHSIAVECNAIPGARKTWRQWRKTWQDLRSNTKKRQSETNGEAPLSVVTLTTAEQEVLNIKMSANEESAHEPPEFVPLEVDVSREHNLDFSCSISEPESPPEMKVFTQPERKKKGKSSSKHSYCEFNCDVLTNLEQRKIQVKEDYLSFKKDYLKQKLKLLKEQTEALKSIARELSK